MRSLIFKTGRTKTLVGSGQITLNYCGGVSVAGGWQGSGYLHPDTFVVAEAQFHRIEVATVAGNVRIETGVVLGPNPNHPGDVANSYWLTRVLSNDFEKDWYNDADSSSPYNLPPPSTIVINFQFKLLCEEWFWEEFTGVRPNSAYGTRGHFDLKPAGKAQLSIQGPGLAHTSNIDAAVSSNPDRFGFLQDGPYGENQSYWMSFLAESHNPFPTDLPFPATYASASGMVYDGLMWWVYDNEPNRYPTVVKSAADLQNKTEFACVQQHKGTSYYQAIGTSDYSIGLNGNIRTWNKNVHGLRVSMNSPAGPFVSMSGNVRTGRFDSSIQPIINVGDLINKGYDLFDGRSLILQYFPTYGSLTLDRVRSLKVFDFVTVPSTDGVGSLYAWTNHNCTVSTSGGQKTVTSTGSGAYIERALKNDFLMIEPDPATWFSAHSGELSSRVINWWNGQTGSPTINLDSGGEWVRIGKRLRPGSDIFNWSSFRYAYLSAKADQECEITLVIDYHNLTITGLGVALPERVVEYPITVKTTMQSHEIDLPSRPPVGFSEIVGHDGLKIIKSIKIKIPDGRIVTLGDIILKEKERPKVDVHHSGVDDPLALADNNERATISAIGDGKHCLFLNSNYVDREGAYPANRWGLTTKQNYGGVFPSSITCRQLANEISLQEGWTANSISHFPNFAVDLEEVIEVPLPTTLAGRRCYSFISVYPRSGIAVDGISNLGNCVEGLVFDPDTHLPVKAKVEAITAEGKILDTQTADAKGYFRLELTQAVGVYFKSSPGTPNELIYPEIVHGAIDFQPTIGAVSRTQMYVGMHGKVVPVSGVAPPVLDVDFLGNRFVSFALEGRVKLGREFGSDTEFKILEYDASGNEVWLHNNQHDSQNPLYLVWVESGDSIVLARNSFLGQGDSKLLTVANGRFPVIRFDKYSSDILYITYWRDNAVYMKHSSDAFATVLKWRDGTEEKKVMDAAVAAPYTFDWLHDDSHTLIVAYMEDDVVKLKKSSDHGETWT